jgi:hypothetical protein
MGPVLPQQQHVQHAALPQQYAPGAAGVVMVNTAAGAAFASLEHLTPQQQQQLAMQQLTMQQLVQQQVQPGAQQGSFVAAATQQQQLQLAQQPYLGVPAGLQQQPSGLLQRHPQLVQQPSLGPPVVLGPPQQQPHMQTALQQLHMLVQQHSSGSPAALGPQHLLQYNAAVQQAHALAQQPDLGPPAVLGQQQPLPPNAVMQQQRQLPPPSVQQPSLGSPAMLQQHPSGVAQQQQQQQGQHAAQLALQPSHDSAFLLQQPQPALMPQQEQHALAAQLQQTSPQQVPRQQQELHPLLSESELKHCQLNAEAALGTGHLTAQQLQKLSAALGKLGWSDAAVAAAADHHTAALPRLVLYLCGLSDEARGDVARAISHAVQQSGVSVDEAVGRLVSKVLDGTAPGQSQLQLQHSHQQQQQQHERRC